MQGETNHRSQLSMIIMVIMEVETLTSCIAPPNYEQLTKLAKDLIIVASLVTYTLTQEP